MGVAPIVTEIIVVLQLGHFRGAESFISGTVAAPPQRWQCLLPMNIIAKHFGQAIVASFEPQNWQSGASVELAAPQLGQLSVAASIGTHFSSSRKNGAVARP
jgi:hypothetical protein